MVARDKALWGECQWGYFRWGVKNNRFDTMIKVFENRGSCNVTRRKLSLSARDSITGWRDKSWSEDTVKGVFFPRGTSPIVLPVGTYVRADGLLIVVAGFSKGDEVLTPDGKYWEVKAIREHSFTLDNFSHRELDLTYLPMHT